jgi:predicted permease
MPITGQGWNTVVEIAGAPPRPDRQRMSWVNAVSPRFFATYGMTLVAGRDFTAADRDGAPLVAIVNEAFSRKFFNGGNPVGREFGGQIGKPTTTTYQVVGLVSDAVYRRLREGIVPTLYLPLSQTPPGSSIALTVQTAPGARGTVATSLARSLGTVDGAAALTIRSFDDYVGAALTQERLVAMLSGFFGGLALLLAALGLYGVTAYGVSRRRAEIGIRMALGAEPRTVVRLVLGRMGGLVGAGVAGGLALSWWASRYISTSLLYGLAPRDTTTFVSAALVLVLVSSIAGWLPARRAARIDPATVLRDA